MSSHIPTSHSGPVCTHVHALFLSPLTLRPSEKRHLEWTDRCGVRGAVVVKVVVKSLDFLSRQNEVVFFAVGSSKFV